MLKTFRIEACCPFDLIFAAQHDIRNRLLERFVMFRFMNLVLAGVVSATFVFSAPAHATFHYRTVDRILDRLEDGQSPEQICRHWLGFKYRSNRLANIIEASDDDDNRLRRYKVRHANMHRNGRLYFKYHRCVRFVTAVNNVSPHLRN